MPWKHWCEGRADKKEVPVIHIYRQLILANPPTDMRKETEKSGGNSHGEEENMHTKAKSALTQKD